jgi:hypothetical protein
VFLLSPGTSVAYPLVVGASCACVSPWYPYFVVTGASAGGCASAYALISDGLLPLSGCDELAARRRRQRKNAIRPSSASPPTMPPTMPPIAPPERPNEDEAGEEVLLGVVDGGGVPLVMAVEAVDAVDAVDAVEADEADDVAGSAVVLVEGSKSASLMGRTVAEGLAETSERYVLLNRSFERFATGFGDVLQQMLIWSLVWVHASLSRTR